MSRFYGSVCIKLRAKARDSYIIRALQGRNLTSPLYNQKWQLIGKSQWCRSANAAVHCAR